MHRVRCPATVSVLLLLAACRTPAARLDVPMVIDEAEAVLALLARHARGEGSSASRSGSGRG
jgi:hypothetical protein